VKDVYGITSSGSFAKDFGLRDQIGTATGLHGSKYRQLWTLDFGPWKLD